MSEPTVPSQEQPDRRSSPESERPAPAVRRSALVITNLVKVVALYIAFHEMVLRHDARESVIGFCVICLVGTQAAEEIAIHAIDRIFARQ